nr:MAG TPA: hypothetical protein [Caudoviricetes sp.]
MTTETGCPASGCGAPLGRVSGCRAGSPSTEWSMTR